MLMDKKTGQSPGSLTSQFSVELPGIQPDALPGNMPPELPCAPPTSRGPNQVDDNAAGMDSTAFAGKDRNSVRHCHVN